MNKKAIPEDVLNAMRMIIVHYMDDEKEHMENLDLTEDKHIYGSLKTIHNYIKSLNNLSTEEK